jgi:DNA helicase-2/ATP-dependent DNA helicase PcrA
MATTAEFEEAYKGLNAEQKKAVDTVEGPVLVVAGPGTGKTHILTLRIANILRMTQATPKNILALTFTDSAARTMRARLAKIVGEDVAREVTITTFHGFAELVISLHGERFASLSSKRLMGDVEQTLTMRDAIEQTELVELRPPKAPYTYFDDIKRLYETMTREAVSLEGYKAWGDEERSRIKADPLFQYKKGEKMGELKKDGAEKLERLDKVNEAVLVIEAYAALKESRGLYDFSDLLREVIGRIAEDDTMRAELQEQYQYVLADEHQDANALQHLLLELFAYDEHPNIFVVGDEKQAIYRFQGAEAGGFADFLKRFPRAEVITLTSSFRSYQGVLDTAHSIIESTGEHAQLSAMRGEQGPVVSLIVGTDPLDERSRVVHKIKNLIDGGELPHDIAIIARKNETADLLASELEALGVPAVRAGNVSLTGRPLIRAILSLMEYAADPLQASKLRTALLGPWWGTPVIETLRLLRTSSDKELMQHYSDQFPKQSALIIDIVEKSQIQTPIEAFSYVLSTSGARDYLLSHAEHLDDIALVRALMSHIEEAALMNPSGSFGEVMSIFNSAREHGMSPVKSSITERLGAVTVITAHRAKGMEFKHVFIPDLTENGWEKGGKSAMIPSPFENKQTLDDVRRLLYVALTRAKDHAYLSYAGESKDGRERKISALLPAGLPLIDTNSTPLPVMHAIVDAPELVTRLSKQFLTEDGLSPSALNEYLESPATFFASRVLRIKEPPSGPAVLGSAVHKAIACSLEGKTPEFAHSSLDKVFTSSLLARNSVFTDLLAEGHAYFDAYLTSGVDLGKPLFVEHSFRTTIDVGSTPAILQGKIDAVFETSEGICIVDFKTGTSLSPKDENYIRQLMLYVELLSAHGHKTHSTLLLGISRDGVKRVPIAVTPEACSKAREEFDDVVRELTSGKWRRGAPSEYDAILSLLNPSK